MYIFSKDGEAFVNSENIACFEVEYGSVLYYVKADGHDLGGYEVKDDAVKELNSIFHQLEADATSYQLR